MIFKGVHAMTLEIKVPSLGESESEAVLERWLKEIGDTVAVDDVLVEIESDKVTMEITAFEVGTLTAIYKQEGDTVVPNEVIGILGDIQKTTTAVKKKSSVPHASTTAEVPSPQAAEHTSTTTAPSPSPVATEQHSNRIEKRVPMTALRRRIASRLKHSQKTAATLTTFNEINMQAVLDLRQKQQESFTRKHGVKLGFMSFFVRACAYAAQQVPAINAFIDGDGLGRAAQAKNP
jgi:2-oxoglutarate dehydrogenase E2 component (dihydrolipoamide succinyltransferase)